ncbi:TonB-dependent receptor, partial [uncultured Flavobacterium sp.]|uniref:TonB-dependent receptor n=1 Tax=uncultured Flavobacterium sp. TaxID=165435 RepID=UPI0025CD82C4
MSLDYVDASPEEVIKNIESRTPYRFVYPDGLDLSTPKITYRKADATIDALLNELQAKTSLNFRRTGNTIAVNKKQTAKKPGKVSGKVVDETGLSLPGATITVEGASVSTFSDADGNYSLSLEPGEYTIRISFMSFQTQNVTGVIVSENDTTPLSIAMKEDAQALDEIVITQTIQKATASVEGMLLEQKRAAQMSDGISAEQIARTPDRDVGATLKRINGVTTVDDRYVVVRSMGDRWNQAVIDGINLPSTDPSQQQFNFEIIPTSMVESVVVSKNATPDMYANFAGGHVEVRTKAIPKEDFVTLTIGTSYNSRSAFKDRLTKQQGKYDYLGFHDGSRSYPKGLETINIPVTEEESGSFFEQSRRFTNDNFSTYKTYAAPGTALQFALGRSYELENNVRWGFVGSVLFRNTQEQVKIEHTERGDWMQNSEFAPDANEGYPTYRKYGFQNSGATYNYNSTLGGMFNAGIQWGDHKFTLRDMMMHIYDNTLTQITGWNF